MDRSSPEYAQMKAAWHERYGGSPKHDHPSEEFAAGWEAAQDRTPEAWTAEHVDRVLKAQALARKLKGKS